MTHAPFTIPPDITMKTLGFCIWCGRGPPEVELRDEHAIPRSLGGNRVLADACCRDCEKDQSAYIGKCCDRMFAAIRFHHGLPVSKKKKMSERTIRVLAENDEIQAVPYEDAPGMILLPILDLPRRLSGRPAREGEFMMIGQYLNSTRKMERGFNEILVTEFTRLIAHIGHSYYMANDFLMREQSLMLPIASGDLRDASLYFGGWLPNHDPLPPPKEDAGIHQIYPISVRAEGVDYVAANIRLFCHLRPLPPVYTVLLCERAIPPGDQYFLFTREQRADGMHVEITIAQA